MRPRSAKLLEDVRDAAAFILDITQACTLDEYLENRVLRQAVERNFEIIGEALNRLARVDPDTASRVGNVPRVIAFRNVLVHGYDVLDHEVVWHVIRGDLPALVQGVNALLGEAGAK